MSVTRSGKIRSLVLTLAMLPLAALSSQAHAQFIHPKIKSKETTIRTVVVMPAKINVVRDSMKGPEGMAAESDELSVRVEKMVAEVLSKRKNVTTLPIPGAARSVSADGDSQ